jgi:hypothetical protein
VCISGTRYPGSTWIFLGFLGSTRDPYPDLLASFYLDILGRPVPTPKSRDMRDMISIKYIYQYSLQIIELLFTKSYIALVSAIMPLKNGLLTGFAYTHGYSHCFGKYNCPQQ